jgi:hypothetical protein
MDLIAAVTVTDLIAGVSLSMMVGVIGAALVANFQPLWSLWVSNPLVQTVVNTTLVVLQNTELVWKPVLNASLVVIKPIIAFALMILKPFGPLALVLADNLVRGMVIVGFITARLVLSTVRTIHSFITYMQSLGVNATVAIQSFVQGTTILAVSLAKIVHWVGYVLYEVVYGVGFLLESWEQVGTFLHRVIFEGHKITWNDVYNMSIPFAVVAAMMGLIAWRSGVMRRKPQALNKKIDDECIMPRRSSRIARKRAMMLCSDSTFASEKPSSRTANL